MAVPETLCHPFATAKIVVWLATCSVRGGLLIAARSGDATLCACGRRGERTISTPERAIVSGQLSALIGAGFELLVAQPSANVSAGIFRLAAKYISTARPWSR
jgi:hypothetical protein